LATKSVSQLSFDDRPQLGVGRQVQAHHALGGHPRGRLAGLAAQLDPQDLLGLGHVAGSLGQRLLALHHRCIGLLAEFLDHARSDLSHLALQFEKRAVDGSP
jgi:hypothetical protein